MSLIELSGSAHSKIGTVVKVSAALTSLLNPIDTARHKDGTYFLALP